MSTVNAVMRPEWISRGLAFIEAFDKLPLMKIVETMRGLDLFSEKSLSNYLGMVLRNKLEPMFAPPPRPLKPKPARPPRGNRAVAELLCDSREEIAGALDQRDR